MIRQLYLLLLVSMSGWAADLAQPWPPVLGQRYPDLELRDLEGRPVMLSSLAGKPLLIELVGMTCAGCQAMLGGNRPGAGGYGGVQPQAGIGSVDEYLATYAKGLVIGDPGFTSVVILLYGIGDGAPEQDDAVAFAQHFALAKVPNQRVLVGDARYIRDDVRARIPGFQIVDKDFTLRSDAAGGGAPHKFWSHSFPTLAELLGR
jgi:hypothetical protein